MYTHLTFPDITYLFGASKLVIFKLQLCPIYYKTCRGSWNIVIMTLGVSSTHATHILLRKVCHNVLKQY